MGVVKGVLIGVIMLMEVCILFFGLLYFFCMVGVIGVVIVGGVVVGCVEVNGCFLGIEFYFFIVQFLVWWIFLMGVMDLDVWFD